MLPLAPDLFSIERPIGLDGDADDHTGEPVIVATGVPCAFTTPNGSDTIAAGRQELVDAVLLFPATPTVQRTDVAVNDRTGDRYRVTWVRARHGLGLDHQRIGLTAVAGGAGG